ncbi:apolipoprotein N-acyltransferase [Candidatus Xenohaliotis californiensis]
MPKTKTYQLADTINTLRLSLTCMIAMPVLTIKKKFSLDRKMPSMFHIILMALCGLLSTLSIPILPLIPVFVTIPILCLITAKVDKRNAFILAWIFGACHQITNMYWIYKPLSIAGANFRMLTPFAIIAIAIFSGFFTAMAILLAHNQRREIHTNPVIFSTTWVVMEYWRNFMVQGFPWGITGYFWMQYETMAQITSIIGIYGLSFLTVIISSSIAIAPKNPKIIAVPMMIMLLMYIYGYIRLNNSQITYNKNINMIIVGSNIEQKYKWDPMESKSNLFTQISNTQNILKNLHSKTTDTNIVVWPETAVPYAIKLDDNGESIKTLTKILPDNIQFLITGAIRISKNRMWNSLLAIDKTNDIVKFYDKRLLVPFGEYIPAIIPMKKITPGHINLNAGNIDNVITPSTTIPNFGTMICYEALMPYQLTNTNKPIQWLINITNDAWFNKTIAPYTHFSMTRIRAIERGVPLIRVANQGKSAVIDPYGRIISKDDKNHIVSALPNPIKPTIFSHFIDNGHMHKLMLVTTLLVFLRYCFKIYSKHNFYYG